MSIHSRKILIAVLSACFHLTTNIVHGSETDPFPTIALPVYQGGYDIENSFNRMKGTKALVYKVQTHYPAAEVLEFYDAALNGRGWKPSFEICQRRWSSLDESSLYRESEARQLFTSWEHPQFRLKISLVLEYQPSNTTGRDEVVVRCRLQPRLDNSRLQNFFGGLKASGQYSAFAKKLDSYRNPEGEVDSAQIARDIQKKKADEKLIAYQQIMDEQKKEIEDIIRNVNQQYRGS